MPLVPSYCSLQTPPVQRPELSKSVVVARRAAPVDDDPARVSQHDRTADAADSEKKAIDAPLRREEQRAHPFARLCDLVLGQPLGGRVAGGIERVQRAGPTPGGGERRACGVVAGNHLENMIRVGGALDLPHPFLPAVPPAASR